MGDVERRGGPVEDPAVRWVAGQPVVIASSGDAVTRAWNPDNGGVARAFGGAGAYAGTPTDAATDAGRATLARGRSDLSEMPKSTLGVPGISR